MSTFIGVFSVLLALLSVFPSFVPGAFSMLGLSLSLGALLLSLFSVKGAGKSFYYVALGIVIFALLLVNDGLRIWDPLDWPLATKALAYGLSVVVIAASLLVVRVLSAKQVVVDKER